MKKRNRFLLGYLCMLSGVMMLIFAARVGGDSGFSTVSKGATAVASGVGGGILTFVVSRRLLSAPKE